MRRYEGLLSEVQAALTDGAEAKFESACAALAGGGAYKLYTLHRIVRAAARALASAAADEATGHARRLYNAEAAAREGAGAGAGAGDGDGAARLAA